MHGIIPSQMILEVVLRQPIITSYVNVNQACSPSALANSLYDHSSSNIMVSNFHPKRGHTRCMSLGAGAGAADVSVACSLLSSLANQKICENEFPPGPTVGTLVFATICIFMTRNASMRFHFVDTKKKKEKLCRQREHSPRQVRNRRHIGTKSRESPLPEDKREASVGLVGSWKHATPGHQKSVFVFNGTSGRGYGKYR
eukprot:1142672-Pelagomonas_calceolata.AAC.1